MSGKKQKNIREFTDFEKKVYRCVMAIPLGEIRTYQWVAMKIGKPKAVRAVGNALNKNPYTVFVPCHRVVKSGGDIGKYSLGKEVKRKLIKLEQTIKNMLQ